MALPAKPINVQVIIESASQYRVSWDPGAGGGAVSVFVTYVDGAPRGATVNGSTYTADFTDSPTDTLPHSLVIYAQNGEGLSDPSDPVIFTKHTLASSLTLSGPSGGTGGEVSGVFTILAKPSGAVFGRHFPTPPPDASELMTLTADSRLTPIPTSITPTNGSNAANFRLLPETISGGSLSLGYTLSYAAGPTVTGSYLVQAEPISIRERILRVFCYQASQMAGVGTVYRWDGRGLRDPLTGLGTDIAGAQLALKAFDAIVIADDETVDEGAQGDIGWSNKSLPIELHVKLAQDEDDTMGAEALINRWLYRMEKAILANYHMVEPAGMGNGEPLAVDTEPDVLGAPPVVDGQREIDVAIKFVVSYQHVRGDPATGAGASYFRDPA